MLGLTYNVLKKRELQHFEMDQNMQVIKQKHSQQQILSNQKLQNKKSRACIRRASLQLDERSLISSIILHLSLARRQYTFN